MLLDGAHLLADALRGGVVVRHAAATQAAQEQPDIREIVAALVRAGVEVVTVSESVMDALSPVRSSAGLVALADRPAGSVDRIFEGAPPLVVIGVDIQDPGNVGAIVRVAEAGGATAVVAAGASADPFGWKALRGSMGSALRLPLAALSTDAAVDQARRHGCRILATAPRGGRSLFAADLTGALAILIGGEGQGLAPSLADAADDCVTIPMQPPVESQNAAVTAALIVYEAKRQRN